MKNLNRFMFLSSQQKELQNVLKNTEKHKRKDEQAKED